MNASLITHLMPITYFGGTGGHLIRSLLIASKVGYEPLWKLSPHGHAHKGPTEEYNRSFMEPTDLRISINDILTQLKNSKFTFNKNEVYYHQFHFLDLDELMKHFAKSIRICYDYKDVKEVSLSMLAKYGVDGRNLKNPDQEMLRKYFLERQMGAIEKCKRFQMVDNNNVLCIKWNTLVREDPEVLFKELSNFTGLEKFSLSNLMRWRELTLTGISEMEQRIK